MRINEEESVIGSGTCTVVVAADSRDELLDSGECRAAREYAMAFMVGSGRSAAKLSSWNGPYPAFAKNASSEDIASGKAVAAGWQLDVKFLHTP